MVVHRHCPRLHKEERKKGRKEGRLSKLVIEQRAKSTAPTLPNISTIIAPPPLVVVIIITVIDIMTIRMSLVSITTVSINGAVNLINSNINTHTAALSTLSLRTLIHTHTQYLSLLISYIKINKRQKGAIPNLYNENKEISSLISKRQKANIQPDTGTQVS